eukprot:TRINITY_DN7150_c0_g1_i2.p1 TRINITY_DN7150_c0_g1~~TRINITY_DN7150_c0_g1_i2.p1  ORF type:complete len:443 (+),score=55.69 TRINITY_DN7150_c0_g1_i2:994-2322(+)
MQFPDYGSFLEALRYAILCLAPDEGGAEAEKSLVSASVIACRKQIPRFFHLHVLLPASRQRAVVLASSLSGSSLAITSLPPGEMWEAVLLTVIAAAGNNIGKVLQKKGTRGLPRLALDSKVLAAYLVNGTWMTGLVIDVSGALLMLEAVARAPVSVVQPVSGVGLAILAVFSHFYLHEAMFPRDWVGVALAAAGTIGVGMTGEDAVESTDNISSGRLLMFVLWLLIALGGLEWWTQDLKSKRKAREHASAISPLSAGHSDVMEEIAAGMQAGACFGMSAAASKTGFILAGQGGYYKLYAPLGIACSISLSSSGFFCQNRGFKEGRAVVVSTCAAVSSIVTGVLVGMVALGETLPMSGFKRALRLIGWALIVVGIVILVHAGKAIFPKKSLAHFRAFLVRYRLEPWLWFASPSVSTPSSKRGPSSSLPRSSSSGTVIPVKYSP